MRMTGPLSAMVFAVASTIGSALSSWLSMPVTSAVLLRLKMTLASLPSMPPFAPRSTNVPLLLLLIACLEACVSSGPHLDFRFFLGLLVATLLTLHSNLSLECWHVVSEGATNLSISVGSDTRNSPSVSSLKLLAFESKEDLALIRPC